MDVAKPYEFTGFGAMDVAKPYEFIGFRDADAARGVRLGRCPHEALPDITGPIFMHYGTPGPVFGPPLPFVGRPQQNPLHSWGVTKHYELIGFGAMEVTKPYEFIGFGWRWRVDRVEVPIDRVASR